MAAQALLRSELPPICAEMPFYRAHSLNRHSAGLLQPVLGRNSLQAKTEELPGSQNPAVMGDVFAKRSVPSCLSGVIDRAERWSSFGHPQQQALSLRRFRQRQ